MLSTVEKPPLPTNNLELHGYPRETNEGEAAKILHFVYNSTRFLYVFYIMQVIDGFGSFSKYIWNFVNHKPIVSQFRYSRQVPVKTPNSKSRNDE